ncbi:MAG: type I 3-dehydroquinate dehydratase [Eubacteriales bacterium]|nr:type I 3-dehydroquinate dehydratase [Eubacteriales bacterium]
MMETIKVRNTVFGEGIPKIAVPLVGKTEEEIVSQAEKAVEASADLLELRADAVDTQLLLSGMQGGLARVREAAGDLPVLYTYRSSREGGLKQENESEYKEAVLTGLRSSCIDLIDIELNAEDRELLCAEAQKAGVPVVLSWHNFHKTPDEEELQELVDRMLACGTEIIKLASMPHSASDVQRVLARSAALKQRAEKPFIMISMGEFGQIVRQSAEAYGSVLTFGCLPGNASAPGQIAADELRKRLEQVHETRMRGKHLFLTGFMGCGKSSAADALSKKTGMSVVEMDAEIEREAGCSISEIFEKEGEQGFRDRESSLLASLYEREPSIVSCGGGAVLRPGNVAMMRCLGLTVLLTAKPETILERLTGESENRPLIREHMTLDGVREKMAGRKEQYEAAAERFIETDGRSVEDIASEIIFLLQGK